MLDLIPGVSELRTRRELSSSHLLSVDLPRAVAYLTAPVMFTDFREAYPLPDRKAFKVGAMLAFARRFFDSLDNNSDFGLPANTVTDGPITMYNKLEECCVQIPGQYDENSQPTYIGNGLAQDLEIIFPAGVPAHLLSSVEDLVQTGLGTIKADNAKKLLEWRQKSAAAVEAFRREAKSAVANGETVDGSIPFVWGLFDELHLQAQRLKKSPHLEATPLIRKIKVR